MRVRILKQMTSPFGAFSPGEIANVSEDIGNNWCKAGIAMQDKSKDAPVETKSNLYWCSKCGCAHKVDSDIGMKHREG